MAKDQRKTTQKISGQQAKSTQEENSNQPQADSRQNTSELTVPKEERTGSYFPDKYYDEIKDGLDSISDAIDDNRDEMRRINKEGLNVRLNQPNRSKKTFAETGYAKLWKALIGVDMDENAISKIDFIEYKELMDDILSINPSEIDGDVQNTANDLIPSEGPPTRNSIFANNIHRRNFLELTILSSSQAYNLLKFATDRYVRSKLNIPANAQPPVNVPPNLVNLVIQRVGAVGNTLNNTGFLRTRGLIASELIWSYWHEESMLVQTMNAIVQRFQNIRNGYADPLGNLELDPLRPLSNILWGYIQDLPFRLTIKRRAYEYDHHYGIRLFGKAISEFDPVDSRSKFIAAFHNLLFKCTVYYKEADDITRIADAFPVFNALREVHMLLTEGMHNQYSDLPVTSRIEMMLEQYILSRQEIWEFLRGRAMVLYDEPWMGAVDSMKTVQGWTNTSVSYYHDLAKFGEIILLTIRFTPWKQINASSAAALWADLLRDVIQRYIYSYNVVTGVDLSVDALDSGRTEKARNEFVTMPGILIAQKYQQQQKLIRRG